MTKLQKMGFIHTSESWDELMDWIERHNRELRSPLIVSAGMGYNMAIDEFTHSGVK